MRQSSWVTKLFSARNEAVFEKKKKNLGALGLFGLQIMRFVCDNDVEFAVVENLGRKKKKK